MLELLEKLERDRFLAKGEYISLLNGVTPELAAEAAARADRTRRLHYGDRVFLRGLVEFTSYCGRNCLYCGIRCGNRKTERYRLDKEAILACCDQGAGLGFRTFVLQGGEDPWYTDDRLVDIVSAIRASHPDCAITLSCGERSHDGYARLRQAGADRYLLRHETASPDHYAKLHPASQSLETRVKCLWDLKSLGFQTGCGFMVGSPWQTADNIADDLAFVHAFQPHMIGIGPFIPHRDTPLASFPAGDIGMTLFLLSLVRLMLPRALIPATTALASLDEHGREKGILAGANVLMPNLSPPDVRDSYNLYDNKAHSGLEAAEHIAGLARRMEAIGFRVVHERGDFAAP